jgi:hypothetical protein
VTLLYKGGVWDNPLSWIQINNIPGQNPIQRVPTELDDLVFNQSLSGIAQASFQATSNSMEFYIGGNQTTGTRCRSIHVSNTFLTFEPYSSASYAPIVNVYTGNGGYVLADSGSNIRRGRFVLHGGNPAITDLEIVNSSYGDLFSHAVFSEVKLKPLARVRFINSALEGWGFGSESTGGQFYAEDCIFKTVSFRMGDNSTDTVLNCSIISGNNMNFHTFFIGRNANFVSKNFNIEVNSGVTITTSGSVLNGNVAVKYASGGFQFSQQDPAHPLPNILNGNISASEMSSTTIGGDLKISGNFINRGDARALYDTNSVYIHNAYIFRVGGIGNFRNGLSLNNCTQNYCHFNLEFFGDTNSNIDWAIGFPVDTLIINKTGCAKVTATNSLYVSGATKIKSGQLVLKPNSAIPYKFVCNGDLEILEGGGLLMGKDQNGTVANIAMAGSLYDYNAVVDSTCTGLSNPYNGNVTLYSNAENMGTRIISIANNDGIGDLNLIGKPGSDFKLGSNLTVNNLNLYNGAILQLGYNLLIKGNLTIFPY